jgi:hypothetical protein
MVISFCVHSELDVFMNTVHMVEEVSQLAWSVWPHDERVVHVAEPAEGLMGHCLQSHFFITLLLGAGRSFEMLVCFIETTWSYIPESCHLLYQA